jgi:hypothetical protein
MGTVPLRDTMIRELASAAANACHFSSPRLCQRRRLVSVFVFSLPLPPYLQPFSLSRGHVLSSRLIFFFACIIALLAIPRSFNRSAGNLHILYRCIDRSRYSTIDTHDCYYNLSLTSRLLCLNNGTENLRRCKQAFSVPVYNRGLNCPCDQFAQLELQAPYLPLDPTSRF